MKNNTFYLRKWYMDMTTPAGECYIGYHAEVRYRKLRFHFTQHLFITSSGKLFPQTCFRKTSPPELSGNCLNWSDRNYSGTWENRQPGFAHTLFENENGFIRWNVEQPLATVKLQTATGWYEGVGYSEQLEMTLPPWQLPLRQLRWGRFVSAGDSVVWINWTGNHPLHITYHNGQFQNNAQFSDTSISHPGFELELQNKHVIRSGEVGKTVFKKAGLMKYLVPVKAFRTVEEKWLGTGTLHANRQTTNGLIIHERVTWH